MFNFSTGNDVKLLTGVRLDNRKAFCTPSAWTKHFERIFYRSINNINVNRHKALLIKIRYLFK